MFEFKLFRVSLIEKPMPKPNVLLFLTALLVLTLGCITPQDQIRETLPQFQTYSSCEQAGFFSCKGFNQTCLQPQKTLGGDLWCCPIACSPVVVFADECKTDSDCEDQNPLTRDSCAGSNPKKCIFEPITECLSGDSVCPAECTFPADPDCEDSCNPDTEQCLCELTQTCPREPGPKVFRGDGNFELFLNDKVVASDGNVYLFREKTTTRLTDGQSISETKRVLYVSPAENFKSPTHGIELDYRSVLVTLVPEFAFLRLNDFRYWTSGRVDISTAVAQAALDMNARLFSSFFQIDLLEKKEFEGTNPSIVLRFQTTVYKTKCNTDSDCRDDSIQTEDLCVPDQNTLSGTTLFTQCANINICGKPDQLCPMGCSYDPDCP